MNDIISPDLIEKIALQSVLRRRIVAYFIDIVIICLLIIPAAILVFILGFMTFGAAWLLYFYLWALVALCYIGVSVSLNSQTVGMGFVGLKMSNSEGAKIGGLLGILHSILFYVLFTLTSGVIILVPLFTKNKRMAHDMLLGISVINERAIKDII